MSAIGRFDLSRLRGAPQLFFTMLIASLLVGGLTIVAWRTLEGREQYYQRKDLRTLEKVGRDIANAVGGLSAAAAIHFDPGAMQFSTSATQCLVGTISVPTGEDGKIDIQYDFVDPSQTTAWLERLRTADETDNAAASKAQMADVPQTRLPGASRCTLLRPPARPFDPQFSLAADGSLTLEQDYRLSQLIWPSLNLAGREPGDAIKKVREAITKQATKQVKDHPLDLNVERDTPASTTENLIDQSVHSAFLANAIHVKARMSGAGLGLRDLAGGFSAIKLLGPLGKESSAAERALLWQVGEVPPLLNRDRLEAADALLLGLAGAKAPVRTGTAAAGAAPGAKPVEGPAYALPSSSVSRIGDLLVYQRDYAGPPGLGCAPAAPCKLVAVRKAADFDREVREIDGIRATWLLIAVLTAIALMPLIHLTLSKRLDPIGRGAQYMLWLSLGMLAASATVAALTIYSISASRAEGERIARKGIGMFQQSFAQDLDRNVAAVSAIGHQLLCRQQFIDAGLSPGEFDFPVPAAIRTSDIRVDPAAADMLDSVLLFDTHGVLRTDRPRWNRMARLSFGASIGDRSYLRKAAAGEYSALADATSGRFVIEQVFSKPDGLRKTVIATPADCAGTSAGATPQSREGQISATAADNARHAIAVATGNLSTFLELRLPTGFRYAVIKKGSPNDSDILFHSDPDTALAARFGDDVDDARGWAALIDHATGDDRGISLSTRYRAQPTRLWAARLHPKLDWVIVLIEDQNQLGFAVWREALFGYIGWALATFIVTLIGSLFLVFEPRALDRQPSMWLWPSSVLSDWTLQFAEDRASRARLRGAVPAYAWRISMATALLPVVAIAPGSARFFLALAVVGLAVSARAVFHGELGGEPKRARQLDRSAGWLGVGFATTGVLLTAWWWVTHVGLYGPGHAQLSAGVTIATATVAAILLWPRGGPAPYAPRWLMNRFDVPREKRLRLAGRLSAFPFWMVALSVAAAAPALAGFLDAHAANTFWSRTVELRASKTSYPAMLKTRMEEIARTVAKEYPSTKLTQREIVTPIQPAQTWITRAVDWLGYDQAALAFSRTPPTPYRSASIGASLAAILPFILLFAALALFKRQFFSFCPPPVIGVPGLTPDTLMPAIIAAVNHAGPVPGGSAAIAPFDRSPCRLHLIVGVDVREFDDAACNPHPGVLLHFDLLRDSAPLATPQAYRGIIIRNFDPALLRTETCSRALEQLEALVRQQQAPEGKHLHIFLFAMSEPLDRIVFTKSQREAHTLLNPDGTAGPAAPPLVMPCTIPDDFRWAELLHSVALYNVSPGPLEKASSLYEQELKAVRLRWVSLLLKRFQPPEVSDAAIVAFVTDYLAEHYRLMWEASTGDEKVILYELARGAHLKMTESFALRSLLMRRLVLRKPEYRLMNRSFARYVLSIGEPEKLRQTAHDSADGTDRVWPLLRIPFAMLVAAGVVMLILVTPGDAGAATLVPAVAAALPALLSTWLRGGRAPSP